MSVNYSSATPAAEPKKKLCKYQTDGTNASLEFDLDVLQRAPSASGAATADAIETMEFCTAGASDITRTLAPAAEWGGRIMFFKKVDAAAGGVLVAPHGGESIDGDTAGYKLVNQYDHVRLSSDGTTVHVVGHN